MFTVLNEMSAELALSGVWLDLPWVPWTPAVVAPATTNSASPDDIGLPQLAAASSDTALWAQHDCWDL